MDADVRPVRPAAEAIFVLDLRPRQVLLFHLAAIGCLLALNLAAIALHHFGGPRIGFFHFDAEANLPTFFSSTMLTAASLVVLPIYFHERRRGSVFRNHWLGLAVLMLYLACDEAAQLHEKTISPLRDLFDLRDGLHYSWVILGAIFVAVFAVLYARLLMSLNWRIALMIFASGAIYVGGALGMEMVSGLVVWRFGDDGLRYQAAATLEETLEMSGIAVFIWAILHLARQRGVGWAVVGLGQQPRR